MPDHRPSGRQRVGASVRASSLARAAPDLGACLPADRQFLLEQISVPVVKVEGGSVEVSELLERDGAWGAIVVDGLVLHDLAIGTEPGLRVLGPADVIVIPRQRASVLDRASYRATAPAELALLGNEFLTAVQREPRLLVGLQTATAEQAERLSAQLVICQMPRVADRVLTMLWLLAESYGHVTPTGTRLELSLTHEALGAMVGARRPTVTLALGDLARRGAVVHQDGTWLLLEPPPAEGGAGAVAVAPEGLELVGHGPTGWAQTLERAGDETDALDGLQATVARLHEQHNQNVQRVRDRLLRAARSHQRSSELRARSRAVRRLLKSRPPPSSG